MASSFSDSLSPSATPMDDTPQNDLDADAFRELDSLSLKEILDQDSRPTFVLDLDPDYITGNAIRPIFCNAALRLHDRLLDSVTGATDDNGIKENFGDAATYNDFVTWATGISRFNDSKDVFPLTLHYHGLLWTGSTIRARWRIVSGNALFQTSDIPKGNLHSAAPNVPKPRQLASVSHDPVTQPTLSTPTPETAILSTSKQQSETASVSQSKNTSKDTCGSGSSVTLATPEHAVPDWTVPNITGTLSEHVAFVRGVDWTNTPLGPMKLWTVQFRELVNLLMRNPHPAALFWGEELTMIYNEAYATEVAGNKHPSLMGTGFSGTAPSEC